MIKIDVKIECETFDEYFYDAIPAIFEALNQVRARHEIPDKRVVGIVMTMRDDGTGIRISEALDMDITDDLKLNS